VKAPLTRGETLPKLGVDAGPVKAWSLADEETDGRLVSRSWWGEVGPWAVGGGVVCGDATTLYPEGPRVLGLGCRVVVPHWWEGRVLGWRGGLLPHQIKGGGGEYDQEGLVPGAQGLRGWALLSWVSFRVSFHMYSYR